MFFLKKKELGIGKSSIQISCQGVCNPPAVRAAYFSFKELVVDSNILEAVDDIVDVLHSEAEVSGNVKISGYDSTKFDGSPVLKTKLVSGEFNVSYKPEEVVVVLDQNWLMRRTDGVSLVLDNVTEDVLTFKGRDAFRTISGKFKQGRNDDYESFCNVDDRAASVRFQEMQLFFPKTPEPLSEGYFVTIQVRFTSGLAVNCAR